MSAALTRAQIRRVDELAVSRYGMVGLQLMENAGRNAAAMIDDRYGPRGRALIACGGGNNGGDGFVIARHLHNRGWMVSCLLTTDESNLSHDCAINYRVVRNMGLDVPIIARGQPEPATMAATRETVLIDALLGTGFSGEVRSPVAEVIAALDATPRRAMVAIDLPSGLDCDTGRPAQTTIRADLTITFVARKVGFDAPTAATWTGDVVVADIGAPQCLVDEVSAS